MDYAKTLRDMGLSDDQIAATTIDGKPLHEATAKTKEHRYGRFRSKWEAMYAAELDSMKAAGEIEAWDYETLRLKLTEPRVVHDKTRPGIWYTPDFAVWIPEKPLRLVEVKGYQRIAAINRYKVAVEKFPRFDWVMVTRKDNRWETIL